MINKSSLMMSPLPKITVQRRQQKINSRITQMIRKLGRRRQMQIIDERSQGFWMQDEVKNSLDRIKKRAHKMKTQQLTQKQCSLMSEMKKGRRHTTLEKNSLYYKKINQKSPYLPQLNQMIYTAQQQESNSLIIAKRRKIIHLLILGLNRRNLGKLYEAIDIVLLASYYFQKDDQQIKLKTICLSLISKLHKQIKVQNLSLKKKSKLNKKRKSLTNFMQNFMQKLRKTKLVGEFSYTDSKRHNNNNMKRINAKCDVIVPKPEQIFDQSLGVANYDYIAVTVDDYTNMFPYEYPKSLNQKISQVEYRQMICKLNGLLFPQSKCYSFSSILKIFYLPFMLIFLIILLFSLLRTIITNQIGRLLLIVITVTVVLVLGIKISIVESGYTNYIEIKDKMKSYLNKWEDIYGAQNIKFRMGQNVDAIFIVFPSQVPDSSLASSKLTEILQVDQNNTENKTQAKHHRQFGKKSQTQVQNSKGIRRAGSRFDQNGNLMKKIAYSKFANFSGSFHKKNGSNIEKNDSNQKSQNGLPEKKEHQDQKKKQKFIINYNEQCQSQKISQNQQDDYPGNKNIISRQYEVQTNFKQINRQINIFQNKFNTQGKSNTKQIISQKIQQGESYKLKQKSKGSSHKKVTLNLNKNQQIQISNQKQPSAGLKAVMKQSKDERNHKTLQTYINFQNEQLESSPTKIENGSPADKFQSRSNSLCQQKVDQQAETVKN